MVKSEIIISANQTRENITRIQWKIIQKKKKRDWFLFWIWMVEKMAQVIWTNQRALQGKPHAILRFFPHSIKNFSNYHCTLYTEDLPCKSVVLQLWLAKGLWRHPCNFPSSLCVLRSLWTRSPNKSVRISSVKPHVSIAKTLSEYSFTNDNITF